MDYKEQRDLVEIYNQIESLANDWERFRDSALVLLGTVKKQYEIDQPLRPRFNFRCSLRFVAFIVIATTAFAGFIWNN